MSKEQTALPDTKASITKPTKPEQSTIRKVWGNPRFGKMLVQVAGTSTYRVIDASLVDESLTVESAVLETFPKSPFSL